MGAAKRRMMVLDSQISVVLRGRGGAAKESNLVVTPFGFTPACGSKEGVFDVGCLWHG